MPASAWAERACRIQRGALRAWIALHKRLRPLLHSGTVVNADETNAAAQGEGVVANDGAQAACRMSTIDHTADWPHGRIVLPGPDAGQRYRVDIGERSRPSIQRHAAPRRVDEGVTVSGSVLGRAGRAAPLTLVDLAVIIHASAVDHPAAPESDSARG